MVNRTRYRNELGQIDAVDVFFPTSGLVSYYKLDGNANDSFGSNTGTATNVTWTAGKINNAGSFNGSSSYINLPTQTTITGNNARTLSFWCKKTTTTIDVCVGIGETATGKMWGAFINNTRLFVRLWATDEDTGYDIQLNTYNHIVLTHNGATLSAYVNGVLRFQQTKTLNTGTANAVIGRNPQAVNYFNGLIDEVGIWNRALTQDEITVLYNLGNGRTLA